MNRIAAKSSIRRFLIMVAAALALAPAADSSVGRSAPELHNKAWLNSAPLHLANLKGKVVMVEFWALGCYNCRNVEPFVKEWHQKYADQGLVIIGVHAPETDRERDLDNVKHYIRDHDIHYAVAIDNDFATWNRYNNHFWPARYLIDKQGILRYVHIGEGEYKQNEQEIRALLAER